MTITPLHDLRPVDAAGDIDAPVACAPQHLDDGITVLPGYLPVPGMGVLPANAYLVDGPEPMIVDTGAGGAEADFRAALGSVIDPAALRWIWLTHTDPDHMGSLQWLLEEAPQARVVTTYLAVGKLGMTMDVPMDRLLWVNPGTTVELNGRTLQALRPPSFDAPETVGFMDRTSGTLFSADAFGALLHAPVADAGDVAPRELAEGMTLWTTIDSPWVVDTDRSRFATALGEVRRLGARRILSAHLPPAEGLTDRLVHVLTGLPCTSPWQAPDQTALDALLASVGG